MTPDEFLAVSDERDQWEARLQAAEKAAYQRGHADGYKDGYEFGARFADTQWRRIVPPANAKTLAELEHLRYGPGGREHFGDPRPGDYPGRRDAAA